jgi:formylglycine-generating enzyme required for sulfatase activity
VDAFPTGASALGVLNLAGNVWEWALDWYDPEYYAVSPRQDPAGPAAGTERVARGGAFATDPQFVRAANRLGRDPGRGYDNVGFRCVLTDPPANAPRLPTATPAAPTP